MTLRATQIVASGLHRAKGRSSCHGPIWGPIAATHVVIGEAAASMTEGSADGPGVATPDIPGMQQQLTRSTERSLLFVVGLCLSASPPLALFTYGPRGRWAERTASAPLYLVDDCAQLSPTAAIQRPQHCRFALGGKPTAQRGEGTCLAFGGSPTGNEPADCICRHSIGLCPKLGPAHQI